MNKTKYTKSVKFSEVEVSQKFYCHVMAGVMIKFNENDALYDKSHPRSFVHPCERWWYEQDATVFVEEKEI